MIVANGRGVNVSSCVDCKTPIIGERLRCPACHDLHAAQLSTVSSSVNDEDVTLPRDRSRRSPSTRDVLIVWLGASLIVLATAVILMMLARSCQ